MNLLNKLTKKNLMLNKKRTLVTIVGIILSVALITAVSSLLFSMKESLISFEISEKGSYHYSFFDVDIDDLSIFKENRFIEEYYLTENIGYAYLKESKNENKPYIFIKAFDENALHNLGINLIEGRLPKNDTEIVIPLHLKTNGRVNYKVGKKLKLKVGQRFSSNEELSQDISYGSYGEEEIKNIIEKEYTIVGIVNRPPSEIEDYSAPGYTFITLKKEKNMEKVDVFAKYTKEGIKKHNQVTANILDVNEKVFAKVFSDGGFSYDSESEYNEIIKELDKAKYKYGCNDYLITLEDGLFKESTLEGLAIVVGVVCFIIIFTSVFCIKNSFDISITEKNRQYGMLSSIGATKKQIKKNVYYEALILGMVGIPIGILCGILAAYILIIVCNIFLKGMLNFNLVFDLSFIAIIFSVILGFITIYLSAWRSAHRAAKISPIRAIRSNDEIKINAKKIKSPKIVKKMFGIGGDIAYKNIKRNKRKYRTTVISIIACVAVFISLYTFMSLAFSYTKEEYRTTDYNILLDFYIDKNKDLDEYLSILELEGINDYSILRSETYNVINYDYSKKYKDFCKKYDYSKSDTHFIDENGKEYDLQEIKVIAVGEHAYKDYLKKLGLNYEDVKDKGILLNNVSGYYEYKKNHYKNFVLPKYNYKVGDKVEVTSDYETVNPDYKIEVAYVSDIAPFGVNDYEGIARLVISDEYLEKEFKNHDHEFIMTFDTQNPDKFQDEVDKVLKNQEYSLTNVNEQVKLMNSFYTLIAIFLYGFITVIALIGITNIFNTITTNMELRKQEFAMLKCIGMSKKEFNRMIRLESFFYGMKSLLLGIPIGCILSYLIYHSLMYDSYSSIKFHLPYEAIIASIIAVFILIFGIMTYSVKKINKQNIIETIRNENI